MAEYDDTKRSKVPERPVFDQAQAVDPASVVDTSDKAQSDNFNLQMDVLTESSRLETLSDEFADENLIIPSVERGTIKDDNLLYTDEQFNLDEQPEFS